MSEFIKQVFIPLLSFSRSLTNKCVSLTNDTHCLNLNSLN